MGSPTRRIYGLANLLFVATIVFASFMATSSATKGSIDLSTAILVRVDQSGGGDFKKIQDAIDSVPSNNSKLVFIWVKPGTYREKIVVPADKPFITLSGTQTSNTIITWNDSGDIFESPTLTVSASDFVGRLLTIENTYGSAGVAVALRVSADRAAFYECKILSYQDTLLDDTGNHYYRNCYIEGATDFICGNSASVFEMSSAYSFGEEWIDHCSKRVSPSEGTGFTFLGCKITGVGKAVLGRPWGPYSRVVYALTYMSSVILPQGWDDWGGQSKQSTVYYGEYKNYGPGSDRSRRVAWSQSLSNDEAATFLTKDIIGGNLA